MDKKDEGRSSLMKRLLEKDIIKKAMEYLKEDADHTFEEQLEMVQIPAPSYMEKEKAEYVYKKMQEIGLEDVLMDDIYNVTGRIKGNGNGPVIMLAGHTDTVFPPGTDVTVKRDGSKYICPGINDDTRAVAEILSIARAMKALDIRGNGDVIFCANVCEEGLGDLRGVKKIFSDNKTIDGFVTIDDGKTGAVIYGGVGSNRYQVTYKGCGGHSFGAFGIPNPIHALGRAINAIADVQVPKEPKTTFNVGVINGGTSVNTISENAVMLIDIRSVDKKYLEKVSNEILEIVKKAAEDENKRWDCDEKIEVEIEQKGSRPAGIQSKDSMIVKAALDASKALNVESFMISAGSTDANIPISLGIPAIAVGRGGNEGDVHTIHEWFEPENAWVGTQKNFLLLLSLLGFEDCKEYQLPSL